METPAAQKYFWNYFPLIVSKLNLSSKRNKLTILWITLYRIELNCVYIKWYCDRLELLQIKQLLNYVRLKRQRLRIWRRIDTFRNLIGVLLIEMLENREKSKVKWKLLWNQRHFNCFASLSSWMAVFGDSLLNFNLFSIFTSGSKKANRYCYEVAGELCVCQLDDSIVS